MSEQHLPIQAPTNSRKNRLRACPERVTIDGMDDNGMTCVELWSSAAFREETAAWVHAVCSPLGIELTGESEQPHIRPWSSAIRFESTTGPVWFKVNGTGTRHEPALVDVLSRLVPNLVADVLAIDTQRGWSLSRDAGPVMRTTAGPDQLWSSWEGLLTAYAEVQIQLSAHVPELLATGTPELTPVTLPGHAAALVEELSALSPEEGGLTPQESDAAVARLREYDAWCAELAGSRIPASIQHDDLHAGNVCWGGSVAGARIIDWGDASVGLPLGTMLCTLNSVGDHAGAEIDDVRMVRVRDAYLEPFTAYAGRAELIRYVALARAVGCVTRALSYRRAFDGEPVATHAEFEFPVRAWFLELLAD